MSSTNKSSVLINTNSNVDYHPMNIDDNDDNNNKLKSSNNNEDYNSDNNLNNDKINSVELNDIQNNNDNNATATVNINNTDDASIIDDNDLFITDDNNNNKNNNTNKIIIQRNVGNIILMLLFLVGIIAGIVNGITLFIIKNLLNVQSMIIKSSVVGVILFMIISAIFCGLSAYITKIAQLPAAVGSGIPELKALLSSDFHPSEYSSFLSLKIEFTRLLSLIFAMGSGLAIGKALIIHVLLSLSIC